MRKITLREFLDYVIDDEIVELKVNMYGDEFSCVGLSQKFRDFDSELLDKNVDLIESAVNRIVVTIG